MKLCLGEIMGGKAHKMIIQYNIAGFGPFFTPLPPSVALGCIWPTPPLDI